MIIRPTWGARSRVVVGESQSVCVLIRQLGSLSDSLKSPRRVSLNGADAEDVFLVNRSNIRVLLEFLEGLRAKLCRETVQELVQRDSN